MIILSQDKKETYIFENATKLRIHETANEKPRIQYVDMECTYDLGDYATEARAKEVLQEIATHYNCCKVVGLPCSEDNLKEAVSIINKNRNGFVYEMPEK